MPGDQMQPDAPVLPFYAATYKGRAVMIKRDTSYEATIKLIQKSIKPLQSTKLEDISISTKITEYEDWLLLITEETWQDIVERVKTIEVILDQNDVTTESHALRTDLNNNQSLPSNPLSITIRTLTHEHLNFDGLSSSTTVLDLKILIQRQHNVPTALQTLVLFGKTLDDQKTMEQCNIIDDVVVNLVVSMRQPMIYIYTKDQYMPSVQVQMSLNRAWELSILYPSKKTLPGDYRQSVAWTVAAKSNGVLIDQTSKSEVSCLFWGGLAGPTRPLTLASSAPACGPESRYPSFDSSSPVPTLSPENSVAIPAGYIEGYLKNVLGLFGLSAARPAINAHWMPLLKSHEFIALRFLSKAECEAAAPLKISPSPDVVVRLFMLFGGLSAQAVFPWETVKPTRDEGAGIWRDIVGTPSVEVVDSSPFRVFEFVGMEIR